MRKILRLPLRCTDPHARQERPRHQQQNQTLARRLLLSRTIPGMRQREKGMALNISTKSKLVTCNFHFNVANFVHFNRSNPGIQYKSECVTLYDYYSLEEGEYLNDAIINFHLTYLAHEKLSNDNKKDVHIFSTHFYTKLSKYDCLYRKA